MRHQAFLLRSAKKAFTLIEILIFAVLIGIVIAAAVPAISQYKAATTQSTMINDGQRLGTAAQGYFAETLERSVVVSYDSKTGKITAPAAFRMQDGNAIAPGYALPGGEIKISFDAKESFTLKHPEGGSYTFDDKGNLTRSE